MHIFRIFLQTGVSFLCLTYCCCVGTAKLSDFPKSAADIDFTRYSAEINNNKTPFWTLETSAEYYIEKAKVVADTTLLSVIEKALGEKGYKIKSASLENKAVVGKRGLRFNEWSSVTGVYFKILNDKTQIYISTHITQDATGGARNNLAKKVGLLIEAAL